MVESLIFLSQLISSMSDAVEKLEEAKQKNNISDFRKLQALILNIHKKIDQEIEDVK